MNRAKKAIFLVATVSAFPSAATNMAAGHLWIALFNLMVALVLIDSDMKRRASHATYLEYLAVLERARDGKMSREEFEAQVLWYRGGPNPGP